jgi:hypothetical protein
MEVRLQLPSAATAAGAVWAFATCWPLPPATNAYLRMRLAGVLEAQVASGAWGAWLLLEGKRSAVRRALSLEASGDARYWLLLWRTRRASSAQTQRAELRRFWSCCSWCPDGQADFTPMFEDAALEEACLSLAAVDALLCARLRLWPLEEPAEPEDACEHLRLADLRALQPQGDAYLRLRSAQEALPELADAPLDALRCALALLPRAPAQALRRALRAPPTSCAHRCSAATGACDECALPAARSCSRCARALCAPCLLRTLDLDSPANGIGNGNSNSTGSSCSGSSCSGSSTGDGCVACGSGGRGICAACLAARHNLRLLRTLAPQPQPQPRPLPQPQPQPLLCAAHLVPRAMAELPVVARRISRAALTDLVLELMARAPPRKREARELAHLAEDCLVFAWAHAAFRDAPDAALLAALEAALRAAAPAADAPSAHGALAMRQQLRQARGCTSCGAQPDWHKLLAAWRRPGAYSRFHLCCCAHLRLLRDDCRNALCARGGFEEVDITSRVTDGASPPLRMTLCARCGWPRAFGRTVFSLQDMIAPALARERALLWRGCLSKAPR